ncbi:MAG TPA: hypothetical protein VK892_15105 [Pyrinomonadaceae bacterium]|nr:hypothetical protein [Pyrinomonadaceae bacterium]
MIKGRKKPKKTFPLEKAEIEKLQAEMQTLKPQTKLGKTLVELSRRNLENEMTVLDADEVMSELGRPVYE